MADATLPTPESDDLTVVYAPEPLPADIYYTDSIFLMGPTPRSEEVNSWRPDCIELLRREGFKGYVLVPEPRPDAQGRIIFSADYDSQIDWEFNGLRFSRGILAYVPRNMETLPGLTTNAEWSDWKKSGKIVVGLPLAAERVRYLERQAHRLSVPVAHTLDDTVILMLNLLARLSEPSCAFCQIATTDKYNQVLWRGNDSVLIEPFEPVTPGHLLALPRIHVHGALSRPAISALVMDDAMEYVAQQGAGEWTVISAVGGASLQTIFHLHIHIVPRRPGDGLLLPWSGQKKARYSIGVRR